MSDKEQCEIAGLIMLSASSDTKIDRKPDVITANGKYFAVNDKLDGYSSVEVNIDSGNNLVSKIHAMPTIYEGTIGQSYNYKIKYGYFNENMGQLSQYFNVKYDGTTTGTHVEKYSFTQFRYYYKLFFEIYRNEKSTPDFITYRDANKCYYDIVRHNYTDSLTKRNIGGFLFYTRDCNGKDYISCDVSKEKTTSGNGYKYTININLSIEQVNYIYDNDPTKDYTTTDKYDLTSSNTVTDFQSLPTIILNCSIDQYQYDIADMYFQMQKE